MNWLDDQNNQALRDIAAGVTGAAISVYWVWAKKFITKLASFACGLALAVFVAPWGAEYFHSGPKGQTALAFTLGLLGLNLANKGIQQVSRAGSLLDLLSYFRKQP